LTEPPTIRSIAELIRDYGIRANTRPCTNCHRWRLYRIPDPSAEIALGFFACLVCDTSSESRTAAKLEVK
jgi:nitrate reductase cytochrome c-type subunit